MTGSFIKRARLVVFIVVVCVIAGLAWFRQPIWPPVLFIDEGFVLDGAINLALYGQYAMRSAEGFRVLDQPLVANGPGIVLPLALSFGVFGIGIEQARFVAGLFMAAAGLAFFLISHRLTGMLAAILSLALLIVLPREGFLYLGRMAIGSVPGLAYFLAGGVVWLWAIHRKRIAWAVVAGVLFGAAAVTKGQYSLVIFPALALAWAVDEFWLKRTPRQLFVAAVVSVAAMLVAWYAIRFVIVGPADFAQHLASVQTATRSTVLTFDPLRYFGPAAAYLVRSGIAPVWLLGMGYAVWQVAHRAPNAERVVLFASASAVWMGWYLFLSNGWARYAFDAYAMACLMAGGALVGLGRWLRSGLRESQLGRRNAPLSAGAALVMATVLALASFQAVRRGQDLLSPPDTSVADFAAYLDKAISPDARVATWEWQLTIFTRRAFMRPETAWVDRYTEVIFAGMPLTQTYGLVARELDYVVDGPFSKWTGLYAADLAAGCCDRIGGVGPYDLLRVNRMTGRPEDFSTNRLPDNVENASERD